MMTRIGVQGWTRWFCKRTGHVKSSSAIPRGPSGFGVLVVLAFATKGENAR